MSFDSAIKKLTEIPNEYKKTIEFLKDNKDLIDSFCDNYDNIKKIKRNIKTMKNFISDMEIIDKVFKIFPKNKNDSDYINYINILNDIYSAEIQEDCERKNYCECEIHLEGNDIYLVVKKDSKYCGDTETKIEFKISNLDIPNIDSISILFEKYGRHDEKIYMINGEEVTEEEFNKIMNSDDKIVKHIYEIIEKLNTFIDDDDYNPLFS